MAEPNGQSVMAGGQGGSCEVFGYQVVCLEADINVEAAAIPGEPTITCIGAGQIVPIGTPVCTPSTTPCGFTVAQRLCIEVPVVFTATATPGETRQHCEPPSTISCVETI